MRPDGRGFTYKRTSLAAAILALRYWCDDRESWKQDKNVHKLPEVNPARACFIHTAPDGVWVEVEYRCATHLPGAPTRMTWYRDGRYWTTTFRSAYESYGPTYVTHVEPDWSVIDAGGTPETVTPDTPAARRVREMRAARRRLDVSTTATDRDQAAA